jgi:hypothetical protein
LPTWTGGAHKVPLQVFFFNREMGSNPDHCGKCTIDIGLMSALRKSTVGNARRFAKFT